LIETEGTGAKEMDLPKIDAEALIAAYGDGAYEQARREARKMLVGKTGFGPSCKQDDINALWSAWPNRASAWFASRAAIR
jgi:hypothetical protein